MKILVVSDYLHQGGAAIACERLCAALQAQGADVHRFALLGSPGERSIVPCTVGIGARLDGLLSLGFGARNPTRRQQWRRHIALRRLGATLASFQPDVVNLHNLHAAGVPLARFDALLGSRPVIWTLHDMWSFTGRCAYAGDCEQFLTGCTSSCPTPNEYPALPPAEIPPAWAERASFVSRRPALAAACPSAWLAHEARRGVWKSHRVENIPNALPLDVFFPVSKAAARAALGLPAGTRFLLFAADYLTERRKGGHLMQAALPQVSATGWEILLLGHAHNLSLPGWPSRPLGYVRDDIVKRLVYSAADLLVHPAPVDNLPNTVAEALACGTPAVAFSIGGLPEMVVPGQTGWLCPTLDATDFASCLRTAMASIASGTDLSPGCRHHAEQLFAPATVAQSYLTLAASVVQAVRHEPA